MTPDIIDFILSLRYPGTEGSKTNWVCYRVAGQVIHPAIAPGATFHYNLMPEHGSHAALGFGGSFGLDMVPDSFSATTLQYGSYPFSGLLTSRVLNNEYGLFLFLTIAEPVRGSVTNLSPLAQRYEVDSDYLIIPTAHDLATILDALRRLHTSTESEQLGQQAVDLLRLMSGERPAPRTVEGGPQWR